ncbi:MAG TPA: peptide chain release factor N(5)-glutamine methyltransferase [Candidatus Acidoferrales bacterium]|nr:peptide chain release factor N(5)-glutamine methyltransferase [Candidatus Acidoferrales bacterium]
MHTSEQKSNTMDVRAALKEAMGRLRQAQVPSYTLAAELLLMHVLDCERARLYAYPERSLERWMVERYFELVARRISGVPTQYLTGRQEFWGLEFEVTPDVLIPRPETEHVVEVALERLGQEALAGSRGWRREAPGLSGTREGKPLRVADVGTGSGCLAVALARELPEARVFATEISLAALRVARRNAVRHGVDSRIHFVRSNLLAAFLYGPRAVRDERLLLDLIVSNPPYVARRESKGLPPEVREHEPARALFGGEQGLDYYAPLVGQAETLLAQGGHVVLELSYNALDFVRLLFHSAAWTNLSVTLDLAGIPRVLAAERA